ncbi:MAG TPA: hypothetical protein VLA49_16900 [Anaerolineales bacterium]|nr:hypothetical protein [Anaerolineales bacterium]
MLNDLPVSPPFSPYDYLAFKESYRQRLDELDLSTWAELYGLSYLEPFRDEAFCNQIDGLLAASQEPILQYFLFAYQLASAFWDAYSCWYARCIPVGDNAYRTELIEPGDPDYVGEIPEALIRKTMDWLLDGIRAYNSDRDLMQNIHWLKYRHPSDTFLDEPHILELEAALGYEIHLENDTQAMALINDLIKRFGGMDLEPPLSEDPTS